MSKNILIAAGGTGGHLFPAMAVGDELIRRTGGEARLFFIGTENRIESKKVPKAGFSYTSMPIKAFPGKNLKAFGWYLEFRRSISIAKDLMKRNEIDALICTGAYLSVPPGYAASKLGVPIFLMESNVNLGRAHKMLLEKANKIFISWKDTYSELDGFRDKAILTGNPVRKTIVRDIGKKQAKKDVGLDSEKPLMLVIGGSLGAESINNQIQKNIIEICDLGISVLWQSGGSFDEVAYRGHDLPESVKKVNFIDDMGTAYAAADFVISRSGATAISEICVCGLPSILIPLPGASNNEQYLNAKSLAENKAAVLMPEKNIDENFMKIIKEMVNNESFRKHISSNTKKFAKPNAAENIARVILDSI
jgi:UDP-N-acetylglucosamine--N-acetylmuramyl-(pentapeptide) pyrophosphoryl-undecaprenol N-acetylglucosamine transferase